MKFLGQQDGHSEHIFQNNLIRLFKDRDDIYSAYLVNVKYEESGLKNVALCLRTKGQVDPSLPSTVERIFKSLFLTDQQLDLIILRREQELELEKVGPAFYRAPTVN